MQARAGAEIQLPQETRPAAQCYFCCALVCPCSQVKIAGIIVSEEVGEQQGARKNQHHVEEVITNLSGDGTISNLHKGDST